MNYNNYLHITKAICNKGFRGNSSILPRSGIGVGGKDSSPQYLLHYDNNKEISEEWNYSNCGKEWFFRTLKKKKTLFRIKILKDTFRVAFWFGDKAEPFMEQSDLPARVFASVGSFFYLSGNQKR
jgi:hypothetical protein